MKKLFTCIAFIALSLLTASAQSRLSQGKVISKAPNTSHSNVKKKINGLDKASNKSFHAKSVKDGNKVVGFDTVLCIQTKKQHGWFAPLDTITNEVAKHRGTHFRFTKKNKAGHWLRMECLDSYGHYVKGMMSPYILKLGSAVESDEKANSDWVEMLKTACIWEFIADYTGQTIVQERAYDENMNIIFTFSRVPIGNNQYNCSYKDSYGLPAEMRNDEDYTYGTLVRITEDRWGNDSVIQYLDAKGLPKLNSDGVGMEVYIQDEYGHLLKQQSRNLDGTLAIDNWGNCGVEYVWNSNHDIESATYMDNQWRPMRMPAIRGVDGREKVITTNYKYDKYRRQIEEYYTDSLGESDVNALGTHRITYEFDDKGHIIKQCGYDENGILSPIDKSQDAIELLSYDSDGRLLSAIFLDKNNKPNSTAGYMSKLIKRYDGVGNQISEERYSAESGEERLSYLYRKDDGCEYTQWDDGSYRIDSLDSKGRTTFIGFYNATGSHEMIGGRAFERHSYIDEEKRTTQTEINYDLNGNKVNVDGICKTITLSDSLSWTRTKWRYDKDNNLIETFIHQYDKGFNRILSQDDANSFGIKSRCGGSSLVRYYTGDIVYNQKGYFASLLGRDEFGEPDYVTSSSITYYYSKTSPNGDTKFYDEDNDEIEDVDELKDKLPKVMTIEVVDSSAYAVGLRDNDIILLYGDYSVDIEALDSTLVSYFQFRRDWSLRSILDAKKSKRMVVFRIEDASKNRYGLVEIKNLLGTPSEIGFIPHIRYLTKKQLARIQGSVRNNILSDTPLLSKSDYGKPISEGNNYILMAYTEMYRGVRYEPYAVQVTDPAIVIGACIKDRNMYWNMTDGENTETFEEMLNSRKKEADSYPKMYYWLTKDMDNVIRMDLKKQAVYTHLFDTRISDEDYALLLDLNMPIQSEIESIRKAPSTIKSKRLYGQWKIVKESENDYSPDGYFYLTKDGTCQGTLVTYGKITFKEGTAVYKIEKNTDGFWCHNDSLISFTPYTDNNITLTCVDLLGTDDKDLIERAVTYMNSICEENKEALLSNMDYDYFQWDDDLFISSLEKNSLIIKKGNGRTITFQKMKGKSKTEYQKKLPKENPIITHSNEEANPLIFGNWETEIPDLEDGVAILSLAENQTMELSIHVPYKETVYDNIEELLYFSVEIGGTWFMKKDSLCIVNNPALTRIDVDIDINGADEETKEMLKTLLAAEIDKQKEEMALQLIKKTSFDGNLSIDKLTETELELNGVSFSKSPVTRHIVIGQVEGETGYLVENGYTGMFVVLKWCDWDCTQSLEEYSREFEKQRNNEKHIVLLPVGTDEFGNDYFDETIELNCPPTQLGLRIQDMEISEPYYQKQVLRRYIDWANK
ncbi:MAG: hypothetical protein IKX35_07105 [Bacteroidales bacterium]|nr:hypothetical protein [Bacteroidales bacterium]